MAGLDVWPGDIPDRCPGTSPTHSCMDWVCRGGPSMPWQEVSKMDQRREFVRLALQDGANRRELFRRVGIHPTTGYKWLARAVTGEGLADQSRRPHTSPQRSTATIERQVLMV